MVGISYELQAFFVDNAAAEGAATEILIEIDGSRGQVSITPGGIGLQSTYIFTIVDASLIGYGTLSEDRLGEIIVLAASMCCNRVCLSPILLRRSVPLLTGRSGMHGELTNIIKSGRSETISEEKFLDIASRLVKLEALNGLPVANLRQSCTSYYWSTLSVEPSTRYGHLWAALEKSVDAHFPSKSSIFDKKAGTLLRATVQEIASLRKINNRVKHAFRNLGDVESFSQLRSTLQTSSTDLKRFTDSALQNRLTELT